MKECKAYQAINSQKQRKIPSKSAKNRQKTAKYEYLAL